MWLRFKFAPSELTIATISPTNYNTANDFDLDYLVYSYVRKYIGLDTGIDTSQAAALNFKNSEAQCKSTNLRFFTDSLNTDSDLFRIQRLVETIIGKSPGCYFADCGWGPGSTLDIKGRYTTSTKMLSRITVTRFALSRLRECMSEDYQWLNARLCTEVSGPVCLLDSEFSIVPGNRFLTVPKDSKTDRGICAEPTGNLYLQKGLGSVIRHRLKRVGVDLNDQSVNQRRAQKAFSQSLATLDLSNASDTLSFELVKNLLPRAWFDELNACRSGCTLFEGEWRINEKFSSMGNGFTFELESLLFYCIAYCSSQRPEEVSVYGDDIICHQSDYEHVVHNLTKFGFTPNLTKSYSSGPFFESCGSHFFEGHEVTPIYQKELVDEQPALCRAANRLSRYSMRNYGVLPDSPYCPSFLRGAYSALLRHYTGPKGPYLEGDRWLYVTDWRKFVRKWQYRGYGCKLYGYRETTREVSSPACAYALAIGRPSDRATYGYFSVRGQSTTSVKLFVISYTG